MLALNAVNQQAEQILALAAMEQVNQLHGALGVLGGAGDAHAGGEAAAALGLHGVANGDFHIPAVHVLVDFVNFFLGPVHIVMGTMFSLVLGRYSASFSFTASHTRSESFCL